MRFLVDAQLPRRFCEWLTEAGYDALHTLDLPLGNRTTDNEILNVAEREQRIVVTKDDELRTVFYDYGASSKLVIGFNGKYRERQA